MTASQIILKTIFRIFVLRVSGKGDHKGSANQLEVLRGYEHVPGVRWLLENFDMRIMQASSAKGRQLRAEWQRAYGLTPLRRKGRDDFLGISLVVDGTRFVLYASTAAQLDEESGNAFTRHLISFIKEPAFTGHADPEFTIQRDNGTLAEADHPSVCNAFDATRFIRSLPRAIELWEAAAWSRAAFDVKDVRVDPEGGEAQQMIWTFLAFGSEMEAVVGKVRRFVGNLNLARAGYFPRREAMAPLGLTTTEGKKRKLLVNDGETTAVAELHRMGMQTTDLHRIAEHLGSEHRVVSADPKTRGIPIHQLQHPDSAARRLYLRHKLLAYRDGELEVRFVGILPNRLRPGSGHVLQRRWAGLDADGRHDEYGAISYRIPAPKPTVHDHQGAPRPGWLEGISAEEEYAEWTALIAKHGWDDDADSEDGLPSDGTRNALLAGGAARSGARRLDEPVMALSRLCLFRDDNADVDGPRTKLFSRANGGRYELRRECEAPSSEGIRYEKTRLLASWPDDELRGHVAALLRRAARQLLDDGYELGPLSATTVSFPQAASRTTESLPAVERLHAEAAAQRKLAEGFEKAEAAELTSEDPDDERVESLRAQAREARKAARAQEREAETLSGTSAPVSQADFGQLRDLIAALEGVFARGLVPSALNRALRDLLPGGLRFAPGPDSVTMTLAATVELPLAGGGTVTSSAELVIPHAAGRGATELGGQRIADLAKRYMAGGESIDEVARAGRIANPDHMLRMIREALCSGSRRVGGQLDHNAQRLLMPDPRSRAASFSSPIPELRATVWHRLTQTPGRPSTATQAYGDLVGRVYFAAPPAALVGKSGSGYARPWAWASNLDLRLDQHTILMALPGAAKQMRSDHLGDALGVPNNQSTGPRLVLDSSTDIQRNGHVYPRTLRRLPAPGMPDGWYGKRSAALAAADKAVGLPLCPHRDCPEEYATAIVFAAEVLHFGTASLCRRCKRPAVETVEARRTVFPNNVIAWADSQPRRPGSWVRCSAAGCTLDIGAGPGMAWKWSDVSGPAWHGTDCRTGASPTPRYRPCRHTGCQIDEGGGPGSVEIAGRSRRRWHSRACEHAERRRARQTKRAARFGQCAWVGCELDEGAGAGSIAAPHHAQKTHNNARCRAGARAQLT